MPSQIITTHQVSDKNNAIRRISDRLASRLGADKFERWFGQARLSIQGHRIEVATETTFAAKWIDSHFAEEISGAARDTLGEEAEWNIRVAPELFAPGGAAGRTETKGCAAAAPAPARRDNATPRKSPARNDRGQASVSSSGGIPRGFRSLHEFVVGASNRLAYAAACRIVDEPQASVVSPLFIYGDCGLGKTHLLQGVCRRYLEATGRHEAVRYITGEQFTNEYIASIRSNSVETFRRRIRKLELLAIDDVHFLSNKVRTQSEFLHTLDALDLKGSRIVLAADEHPRLIKKFSQALTSRFLSGMVVQVEQPDRETRLALVRHLAAARHLALEDAAVEAIASRCLGSVRELEGVVTKLAALSTLSGLIGFGRNGGKTRSGLLQKNRASDDTASSNGGAEHHGDGQNCSLANAAVGLLLVEQMFKEQTWEARRASMPIRIGSVIESTCRRLGISRTDLMGSSRHQRVVLGRGIVAFLGRELTTLSYPEIARALGRSYHSTIHTAEQRLRRQMGEDQIVDVGEASRRTPLKELVDQLRHEIGRHTPRT